MEVSYGSGLGWLLKCTSTKAVHEKKGDSDRAGNGTHDDDDDDDDESGWI